MRIGIMTFWWSNDNYGQLLQCYALQKYLRDAGHEAYLIRYRDMERSPLWKRIVKGLNPYLLYKYLLYNIRRNKIMLEQSNNNRGFDQFREQYLVQSEKLYHSYQELKDSPPEADCYVVGSDQVWNFSLLPKARVNTIIHAYMLDFGPPETKRVSYAASWSVDSLSSRLVDEIQPLLQRFSYVSVREERGIELCRQCGYERAELVCDPTLLLDADAYRTLYQSENVQKREEKYLLLYMLNNQCGFDIQKVYDFARGRGLEVVYVTGNGVLDKRDKCFATIPEWLYLIDNAEYVVTNSFHCCVFSALLGRRFGVVRLTGKLAGMNTRLESLFKQLELEPRWIGEDLSVLDRECKACPVDASQKFLEMLNATNQRGSNV